MRFEQFKMFTSHLHVFFENSVYFPIPPLWLDCLFLIYLDNLLPNVLLSSLLPFKSCFFTQLTVCFAEAFNFMRFHLLISDLTSWATGKVFICILSVLLTSPFLFCLCICLCLSLSFFLRYVSSCNSPGCLAILFCRLGCPQTHRDHLSLLLKWWD